MSQALDFNHICYSSPLFRQMGLVHRTGRRKRLPIPAGGRVGYSPVRDDNSGQRLRKHRDDIDRDVDRPALSRNPSVDLIPDQSGILHKFCGKDCEQEV